MKAFLALAILLAALLAGCSSTPSGPVSPPMTDGKYIIHMTGSKYLPADAKVPVGATVRWVNDESTPHDVTTSDHEGAEHFDSGGAGQMKKGHQFEHTFTQAGKYAYECQVHASTGMKGTITVE